MPLPQGIGDPGKHDSAATSSARRSRSPSLPGLREPCRLDVHHRGKRVRCSSLTSCIDMQTRQSLASSRLGSKTLPLTAYNRAQSPPFCTDVGARPIMMLAAQIQPFWVPPW